jgi:Na+-translocating ferredoxin:NAD+ oxidoreductase RnfC subunit
MGGAGFPTAVKLNPGATKTHRHTDDQRH